jgi:hypothetical protein
MTLPRMQLVSGELPSDLARYVVNREAILWVGTGFDNNAEAAAEIAQLVALPWQAVLLESARGETARLIETASSASDRFSRIRGFVHLIAENPADLVRSPRSLPVYMLNGRSDATDVASSTSLPSRKGLLRRLTILDELRKLRPRVLVVVTDSSEKMLEDVFESWGTDGFAPRLVFLDPFDRCKLVIDGWLAKTSQLLAIDRCVVSVKDALQGLLTTVQSILPDDRLIVHMLRDDGRTVDVDVSECEPIEFPLLDRFDIILSRHLISIAPEDLTDDEINQFFDGSLNSNTEELVGHRWAGFAAGLPKPGRTDATEITLRALENCLTSGSERNRIVILPSEPGAGGTTEARLVGFAAARAGYPVLLAKNKPFSPNPSEVAAFLTLVADKTRRVTNEKDSEETPWLIVFDVAHWQGREAEGVRFLREITRGGRSVVMLCAVEDIAEPFRLGRKLVDLADKVCHDITQQDAEQLGRHLNKFLVHRGRAVPPSDWITFWQKHSPMTSGLASFWVALSFWLRKQLDLHETIQAWLDRQFRSATVPEGAWSIVLEVAALSIEREGAPEGIFPLAPNNRLAGDVLDEVKKAVPSLGLHFVGTGDRVWYIAHDLLGRLLLNIVFHDREALTRFGLAEAQDPTHLRVLLLRRIATRSALDRKVYQPLALQFPINILKLDNGRLEFARYWTEVLAALDEMPQVFRNTSRAYKHHVAITRRRVCTIREYFDIADTQRQVLLEQAIRLLEEGVVLPLVGLDDETDLNMYNSLSLAYQDLAEVEQKLGALESRLTALWKSATEAAQEARRLNPRNSYVLETLARNLILTAKMYPDERAERAAEALSYVYEAMSLEMAIDRQRRLLKFAEEAIEILRDPSALQHAVRLASTGNPFGHLALAWLELAGPTGVLDLSDFAAFPKDRVRRAMVRLEVVEEFNALVLQMQYKLTVAADQWDFAGQLCILDSLHLNLSRMPLQLRLERAILLHQENRHKEANELFDEIRRVNWDPANQEYVVVPNYLEWLVVINEATGKRTKRVCNAKAIPRTTAYRKFAKVEQLQQADVPYNPREFLPRVFATGNVFKCFITFGHNGPLIKPAVGEEGVA